MKKLLLLCVLAVAVGGCSPSEKSIQKAVEKGDYLYVEKYLSNPKYWNDPNKYATNAVALEALILLNRIDSAVNIYKENKEDPSAEGRIVNAIANGLKKSTIQKVPEKIVELINDDRNNDSDVLLRNTVVEIEKSIAVVKIKAYTERAIENRKNANIDSSIDLVNKAISWDIKSTLISDVAKILINHYTELKPLYDQVNLLNSKKEEFQSIEDRIKQEEGQRLSSGQFDEAFLGIGSYSHTSTAERNIILNAEFSRRATIHKKKETLKDIRSEIQAIEKTMPEYEAKINAKTPEVEAAEAQFMEKLNATSK